MGGSLTGALAPRGLFTTNPAETDLVAVSPVFRDTVASDLSGERSRIERSQKGVARLVASPSLQLAQ
jgi:hypothetical protein